MEKEEREVKESRRHGGGQGVGGQGGRGESKQGCGSGGRKRHGDRGDGGVDKKDETWKKEESRTIFITTLYSQRDPSCCRHLQGFQCV